MYARITASSRPTVDTKYPRAQKCCPTKLRLRSADLLVAISSSGRYANILNAVAVARSGGARIVTFCGFGADNALRLAGDVNFYVGSSEYGFVEVAHLSLCHAALDIEMSLRGGYHPAAARDAELVDA